MSDLFRRKKKRVLNLPEAIFMAESGSSGDVSTDVDPDDEELDETPDDVVEMLGFDPADEDDTGLPDDLEAAGP